MASVHYDLMVAAKAKLEALTLSGIADADIVLRWTPHLNEKTDTSLPRIHVAPGNVEQLLPGLTSTDDVVYPIIVALWAVDPGVSGNLETYLGYRESIRKGFSELTNADASFSTVTKLERIEAQFITITELTAWEREFWQTVLLLNCTVRDTRG